VAGYGEAKDSPIGAARLVRFVFLALGVLVFTPMGAGCQLTEGSRSAALHDELRSLLVPSAVVLDQRDGDCIEFAPSPSCVIAWFEMDDVSFAQRERRFRERARAQGWQLVDAWPAEGGVQLFFEREGYKGNVTLYKNTKVCGSRIRDCRESVRIVRQ
jgi:hypothetical protein